MSNEESVVNGYSSNGHEPIAASPKPWFATLVDKALGPVCLVALVWFVVALIVAGVLSSSFAAWWLWTPALLWIYGAVRKA